MNLEIDGTNKILLVEDSQGLTLNTEKKEARVAIAGVSEKGPQGDRGLSGIVNVTSPIINSGTESEANIGIIVGSGGVADHAAVQSALAAKLNSSTAASTYLTITDASSTYLSQSNATSTYLTQSSATSTYLTQANAASTYVSLNDARLSNERTPTDGSVTDAKIVTGGLNPSSIAGTAVITTDSRLSNARTPLAHTHTLSNITDAGTAAGKDVGTGSNQVAAGDHTHTGLSVQNANIPSVRSLGTGATEAAAGNDSRIVNAVLKNPVSSQTITNSASDVIPLSITQSVTASNQHTLQASLTATSGTNSTALNVVSNNSDSSAMWLTGKEYGHGTLKVAHVQPSSGSDGNAAAISINLAPDSTGSQIGQTASQGIYLDTYRTSSDVGSTPVGTSGSLLNLKNAGNQKLVLTANGQLQLPQTGSTGGIVIGGDAQIWRAAANVLRSDDTLYLGKTSGVVLFTSTTSGSSSANGNFAIGADGKLEWGAGGQARDVYIHRDGINSLSVNGKLQVSETPTSNNDVVRKSDLDNVASGLNIKAPVRVATNANISTLAGQLTVNPGVTVTTGDRILVKDQNTQSQNGIYVVGASPSYTWTRATDMDTDWSEVKGAYTLVLEGTEANTGYIFNGASTGQIGTNPITFVKFTTTTSYSAQTNGGLALSGTQFYIDNLGVTDAMLAGSISDSKLSTITSVGKVANSATTASTGNANPALTIVAKDSSGDFAANNITANLIGNSDTATNIASGTTTLASNVVNSYLTKIGSLSSGTAGFVKVDSVGNLTSTVSIVNADINASAAISYSKLNLAGSIANSDLAGSIANNKLANSTISGIALGGTLSTLNNGLGISSFSYTGGTGASVAIDTSRVPTIVSGGNAVTFTNSSGSTRVFTVPNTDGTIALTSSNITGNADTATKSTNISNGAAGSLPYQSGANATTFLAAGANTAVLTYNTSTSAPQWTAQSSIAAGTVTDANVAYKNANNNFSTSQTITGTITATSANITGLTASQFVKTDSSKNLTSATIASTDLPSVFIGTTSVALSRSSGSQTLNGVSIDGNAGTVTNGFYTTSSFNLGTTSIAVNRASGSQSLTGVSIDGNAGTVTNGVYTNANNTLTGINTFNGGVRAKTRLFSSGTSDTILDSDYTVYYSSSPANGVTLPTPTNTNLGQIINIKNGTISVINVIGNIDGTSYSGPSSYYTLPANAQYQTITFQCLQISSTPTYTWAII